MFLILGSFVFYIKLLMRGHRALRAWLHPNEKSTVYQTWQSMDCKCTWRFTPLAGAIQEASTKKSPLISQPLDRVVRYRSRKRCRRSIRYPEAAYRRSRSAKDVSQLRKINSVWVDLRRGDYRSSLRCQRIDAKDATTARPDWFRNRKTREEYSRHWSRRWTSR